jgi:hypothetical protein
LLRVWQFSYLNSKHFEIEAESEKKNKARKTEKSHRR